MRLESCFGWLWSAYAVSAYGTWIAFGAFPLAAVRVLHLAAFAVSLLKAASLGVAAIVGGVHSARGANTGPSAR